jgi:aspartyl-tRNA(Asn)/glutamyl-tRNA(Gln) amidotransferase subunit B
MQSVRFSHPKVATLNTDTDCISAYEVQRQSALLKAGETVEQQTRGFDASDGTTSKLRSKSDAPDYRYMPDPELAPLIIPEVNLRPLRRNAMAVYFANCFFQSIIDTLKAQMPLLPDQVRDKLENKYDLTSREVDILVRMSSDANVEGLTGLEFFEQVANGRKARTAANWCVALYGNNLY